MNDPEVLDLLKQGWKIRVDGKGQVAQLQRPRHMGSRLGGGVQPISLGQVVSLQRNGDIRQERLEFPFAWYVGAV